MTAQQQPETQQTQATRRRALRVVAGAAVAVLLAAGAGACSGDDEVTLLTHDSFALSDETLAAFTEQTGYRVEHLASGDAGELVASAVLTADNPLGDVLFGVASVQKMGFALALGDLALLA